MSVFAGAARPLAREPAEATEALRFVCAAGAQPSLPYRDAVEALMDG